jgi:type III secretory pathway component EscV
MNMNKGPKYLKHTGDEVPHIGQILTAYYKKKKIYQAALARDMNRTVNTMVSYKKNHSMQTAVLWELCHVLKYNFFADLAVALPDTFGRNNNEALEEKDKEITTLQAEVTRLQQEKDLLVHLIKDK